jgi:hypothetical protein
MIYHDVRNKALEEAAFAVFKMMCGTCLLGHLNNDHVDCKNYYKASEEVMELRSGVPDDNSSS